MRGRFGFFRFFFCSRKRLKRKGRASLAVAVAVAVAVSLAAISASRGALRTRSSNPMTSVNARQKSRCTARLLNRLTEKLSKTTVEETGRTSTRASATAKLRHSAARTSAEAAERRVGRAASIGTNEASVARASVVVGREGGERTKTTTAEPTETSSPRTPRNPNKTRQRRATKNVRRRGKKEGTLFVTVPFRGAHDARPPAPGVGPSVPHAQTALPEPPREQGPGGEPHAHRRDGHQVPRGHAEVRERIGEKSRRPATRALTFVPSLVPRSLNLPTAKTTDSAADIRLYKKLNIRSKLEPCQKYKRPITSSQEVGWGMMSR